MKKLPLLLFFLGLLNQNFIWAVPVTRVFTQEQFEAAVESINKGKAKNIVLGEGVYVLNKPIVAHSSLSITGNGATIIAYSHVFKASNALREDAGYLLFKLESPLSHFPVFFDENNNIFPVSESVDESIKVNLVDGIVECLRGDYRAGSSLRISIPSNLRHLKNKSFEQAFGYFDCGWKEVSFKLERSDDAYFYGTSLNSCSIKDYQYDKVSYKRPLRFVIYNAELKPNAVYYDNHYVYVPKDVGTLYCVSKTDSYALTPTITTYSHFRLNGVNIIGFDGIDIHSKKKARCEILNCIFRNCPSNALIIHKDNCRHPKKALIKGCSFYNCSLHSGIVIQLISSLTGKTCIEMDNCIVSRYEKAFAYYKNPTDGVYVSGDVVLTNNIVYNTCRDHLYFFKGNILASGNFIYNTDEFNSYQHRNLGSDFGLIYCGYIYQDTQSALDNKDNRIVLKNNLLYGAKTFGIVANGIYIDDGRGDVFCQDNIILGVQHYSINARNAKTTNASSVRNRYERNFVTRLYKLEAGEAVTRDNIPVINGNYLFNVNERFTENVQEKDEDIYISGDSRCSCENGQVLVSSQIFNVIRTLPVWEQLGKYITCEAK